MEKLISSLVDESFTWDCKEVVLAQQVDSGRANIYSGTGTVLIENGVFVIKLIIVEQLGRTFNPVTTSDLTHSLELGTVIPKEMYFKASIKIMSGEEWCASDVYLKGDINYATGSAVLLGKTTKFEKVVSDVAQSSTISLAMFFTDTNIRVPFNKHSEWGDNGSLLNVCEFYVGNVKCKITAHANYLELNINECESLNKCYLIIRGLEVFLGKKIRSSFVRIVNNGVIKETICANDFNEKYWRLAKPIEIVGFDVSPLESFLIKYMEVDDDIFYRYWAEIWLSCLAGREAFALSVSVNVEGMIDKYFSEYKTPPKDFVDECLAAKKAIQTMVDGKGLVIAERALKRIFHNLDSVKGSTSKNALYKIFKDNTEACDDWNSIRHPAAHGSLRDKKFSSQALHDATYSCLFIFYALMLKVIGYDGDVINYSKSGYPSEPLSIDLE